MLVIARNSLQCLRGVCYATLVRGNPRKWSQTSYRKSSWQTWKSKRDKRASYVGWRDKGTRADKRVSGPSSLSCWAESIVPVPRTLTIKEFWQARNAIPSIARSLSTTIIRISSPLRPPKQLFEYNGGTYVHTYVRTYATKYYWELLLRMKHCKQVCIDYYIVYITCNK